MGHDTSFTLDDSGNVSDWSDEARRYPSLTAAGTVGKPAGQVLQALLDHPADENTSSEPAVLLLNATRLNATRDNTQTNVTVRGVAPSLRAAQLEAAYESPAFEQSTAGLELYDAESHVVHSNSAALAMRGRTADQVLERHVADLGSRLPTADFVRQTLEDGRPVVQGKVRGHDGRGQPRVFAVTAFQLRDDQQTIGVGSVIHDVTAQDRPQAAADLLAHAHKAIGTTLEPMRTARELAVVATQDFAEVVSVDLIDAVLLGEEAPTPPVDTDIALRRAAFEAPESIQAIYAVGEMSHFVSPTPYTRAMADLTPRLLDPETSPSDWLMHDVARNGALKDARVHSMIVVPLSFQGRALGLASFYRGPRHPVPFDAYDMDLAAQVSAKACIHIENARRYTREHTAAVTLQRRLLPRTFPDLSAVSTAHFYTPGTRHTVWFDVVALSAARVGLVIGQIPQQGLDASVTMGQFRTALSTLAALELPPDELLAHLDDVTGRIMPCDSGSSASDLPRCLYAVYDPVAGDLAVASAGWLSPLVTSPAGEVTAMDLPIGPPLGQGATYELSRLTIAPESVLTLYSQSFLEPGARSEEHMGRLRRAAAQGRLDPKATCDSIVQGVLDGQAADGVALLAVHAHRLPDDRVATWDGSREPAAVAECRDRVGQQLEEWGLESHAFMAEMVVSELVTNVIRHASGNPTIRLIRDRSLTIEVADSDTTAPHLRHARVQDEDGRGLLIIAALARRWGTRYTPTGKVIWVEEPLAEDAPR